MDCAVGDTNTFLCTRVSMDAIRAMGRLMKAFEEVILEEDTAVPMAEEIPLEAWNLFAELKELPHNLHLRQLVWANNRVLIVEYPTRPPHEHAVDCCTLAFGALARYGGGCGQMTLVHPNDPSNQADYTFRPRRSLQGTQRPANIRYEDWVTVIVEILHSQEWAEVHAKVQVYRQRPGVEYILCVKMSRELLHWSYEFYDVRNNQPQPPGVFDETTRPAFDFRTARGLHRVVFDTRRVLGLPQGAQLLPGCPVTIGINVLDIARSVRDMV